MTDDELRNWEKSDSDINDDLHKHFESWGRWDWCDTAAEALRITNIMFSEEIETDSPIDAITTAAVAHAYHMAYEAMAAALGVDAKYLRITVADWSEKQDNLPPPVTPTRLMEMIKETEQDFAKYDQRR